ncbi:hypothetical protein [Bradyrhizobium japonicum]|nr:hypothetical protein [Bradyrhizobium japonicum]
MTRADRDYPEIKCRGQPIHPKAVPVILTTDEERDVWMRATM